MKDGSSRTSAVLLATLVPTGSSLKTCPAYSVQTVGMLWPESLQRWPLTGSLHDGQVFELPTLERPTSDCDGSVLPTPASWDGRRGPDLARADRSGSGGMDLTTTVERLLPTPTAAQPGGTPEAHLARKNVLDGANRTKATDLRMALVQLLPTPTAQAAKHANDDRGAGSLDDHNLWAVVGRLLPTPTARDHKDGAPCDVPENALLGRAVWRLHDGDPTPTPLPDGNQSPGDQPPSPPTTDAGSAQPSSNG
jgi:hypothetical protein